MIARLLISPSAEIIKTEVIKNLASHMSSGNSNYFSHPDLLYFPPGSKLGIAEARKIIEHFSLKPYSAKGRVVILEDASALTIEAQNALLKILEELPIEALLILGATSEAKFLPTILSRCEVIHLNQGSSTLDTKGQFEKDIEKLQSSNINERFEYIEKLKDKPQFLDALTAYFHQDLRSRLSGVNLNFLSDLLQAEEWAKQNVNTRAILEYLMLVMPSKK